MSRTGLSSTFIPMLPSFSFRNPISKSALWQTSVSSPINSFILFKATRRDSPPASCSSVIWVSCLMNSGTGPSGLINTENVSVISFCTNFVAPISIISFTSFLNPVVSISKAVKSILIGIFPLFVKPSYILLMSL